MILLGAWEPLIFLVFEGEELLVVVAALVSGVSDGGDEAIFFPTSEGFGGDADKRGGFGDGVELCVGQGSR